MPRLSNDQRNQVIGMLEFGKSDHQADFVAMGDRSEAEGRLEETRSLKDRPREPAKTSRADDRAILLRDGWMDERV